VASQKHATADESALAAAAQLGALVAAPEFVVQWVAQPLASLEEHYLLGR
jgi:hypothetical protein